MRTCSNKPVLIFERKELIFKCAMYLLLISIERGDLTKVLYILTQNQAVIMVVDLQRCTIEC